MTGSTCSIAIQRHAGKTAAKNGKELDRLIQQIVDAGGRLMATSWSDFRRKKKILEGEGGEYGTLPTGDGRTKHQVKYLYEGTRLLVVEFITAK